MYFVDELWLTICVSVCAR